MTEFFLSIIIPHYNDWKRLCRAIESVPSRDDLQIIVVDDKSEGWEQHLKLLQEKYPNVEFYENLTNQKGAGQARNIGLDNASGRWLCFMDADDYFLEAIEEVLFMLAQEYSDNVDVVYFAPTSFFEGLEQEATRHQHYEDLVKQHTGNPSANSELRLRYLFYSPCSKFVRRNLVIDNSIRFDTVLYSNDVMFSTKIGFFAKKVAASNAIYYCISEGEGSLTKTVTKKSKNLRFRIEEKQYRFLKKRLSDGQMRELGYGPMTGLYYGLLRTGIDRDMLDMCYTKIVRMFKK